MNKNTKLIICSTLFISVVILISVLLIMSKKTFMVEFNSNGGTYINTQQVNSGETAAKPIDPVKEGYEFDGWYLNNEKYYFTSEVTKDIILVAKWNKKGEIKEVTVTFDTDGGNEINPIKVEIGKKIEKPTDPEKDGYVFVEWLLNNNSFNFDNVIKTDITLVASYKKVDEETFTVTFKSEGGSSVKSQTVKKGAKASTPKNPTRTGYTFNGWYLDGKKFNFNTVITKDITLTASWTKNSSTGDNPTPNPPAVTKYTVTFQSNGGSSVATQTIEAGGKATKPQDPTRSGYKFIGWMHNGGAYNFDTPVNGNVILVAEWELIPVPDVYTVSLELINGETNIPERKAIVYKNGVAITAQQLLDQDGKVLGKHISSLGAIRVNKAQYDAASSIKVKLADGSVVSATKK